MLRSCKYVAAWMAVAAVAVTVSWLGVRVGLAPALTAESPVAIDVNRRYTEVHLGFDDVTPAPSVSSTPSRPKPSKSATVAPRPAATKRPAPKPSTTPSVHPATSAPADQKEYEITAEGGTATVAYSATRVDAVDAQPIDGYVASYTRRSDTTIVIRLDGPAHSSVITAYWLDGPHARIAEEYAG
ncbi:hypothetical protein [Actinoplanes subtropicus]|uniref:hypothetical protein n=1 Tax=Actinoplanes subtropicus TaxID=543632 RepID=UPI000AC87354|nr:hypothetical protein [Actinoplanes subtropicus]